MKNLRAWFGLFLVVCLLIVPAMSADKKVEKKAVFATSAFDGRAAWSYINDLASEAMNGRQTGTPGDAKAADYIAAKFKEWSLEPAGANGTYFQPYTIEFFRVEEGVHFEIINARERRCFHLGEGWRAQGFSGSGNFDTNIVFAGYGIHAPDKGYDDYAGVDVKGKLVMFAVGTPAKLGDKLKAESEMKARLKAAREAGAVGALLFSNDPEGTGRYGLRVRLNKDCYNKDFVILSIDSVVLDSIFKFLPTELPYAFGDSSNPESKPTAFDTGVKAFVSVKTTFDEKRPTRNILAKITGSDKTLKEEYIVVGGHMDHLGTDPYGEMRPGADDNASGTSVVMELARVMKLKKVTPKRTIVFAAWSGEEEGLLGSKYYSENSTQPIEKTVANINLDMVSEGDDKLNYMGMYYGPDVWALLKAKLPKEMMDYVTAGRGGPGGSDHTYFLSKGVPGFFIITEGPHYHYHQPYDVPSLARPEILKKTGDLVGASVEILGNEQGDFFPPLRAETYQLKLQTLVNYMPEPLSVVIDEHKDAADPVVDVQLAALEQKEELNGDALFLDMLRKLGAAKEAIKKTKALTLYTSSGQVYGDSRQGKVSVIPGLRDVAVFRETPQWADVLAKQGVYFVLLNNPAFMFNDKGLSDEGQATLEAVNAAGLALMVKGLPEVQAKALLEASAKPVILIAKDAPGKDILDLIKKKSAALGLVLDKDDDPAAYFKKLDEACKAVGAECLMLVNQQCLWEDAGRNIYLKFITELIKAKWESQDLTNIFSGTLLRVLSVVRADASRPSSGRPF